LLVLFATFFYRFGESLLLQFEKLYIHLDLLDGVGLRPFGDLLGVVLALDRLSIQHLLRLHHDLIGLLRLLVVLERELDVFQELLHLLVLLHTVLVVALEL